MAVTPSNADLEFRDRFEAGGVGASEFRHREHLRLAFVYLSEGDAAQASRRMRLSLKGFLAANGAPASKYHETLTRSWVEAVAYFISKAHPAASFDAFLAQDDRLLDHRIMLTHYARETLFSETARRRFVRPDREPIPAAA